jgi:pimeloyl-ACP methyl ester carboxylesterase
LSITFGSDEAQTLLDAAYQDVEAAFLSWRDNHLGDRRFVILGHSQGTYLTTRLLQEQIEPDPALRERLILGLMIGGSVGVPDGELVGGSFSNLALCSAAGETGCVLAYRSYAVELPPGPGDQQPQGAGDPIACTDASALTGGGGKLRGAYLPTFTNQPAVFVPIDYGVEYDTPFVLYRDLYTGRCETDVDGNQYLAIGVEPGVGDVRQNPIDFTQPLLNPGLLGLHVFDYNFAIGDLLELVEQAASN